MSDLCCSVNPKEKCRACDRPLCEEHRRKGRSEHTFLWCRACADTSEDYINIIADLTDKLNEAVDEFDSIASDVDDIHGHVSRCRNCRSDTLCSEIFSIIDNAGTHASSSHRRVMRLNR